MTRLSLVLALTLMICSPTGGAQDEALRVPFRAALAEAEAGRDPAAPDAPELRGYVLYPYVLAARLKSALARSPGDETDAAVAGFLRQYADLAMARELRRAWLMNLGSRGEWGEFLAAHDPADPDAGLRCHQYNAWIQTGDTGQGREDLLALWLTGAQMPQSCVAPFQWLREQGALTPELLEQRARLALKAGNGDLADWLLRTLPAERAAPLAQWLRLQRDPRREIERLSLPPAQPVEFEALADGWARLTRTRPLDALLLAAPLIAQQGLDPHRAGELRRELALGLAWDRRAEAVAQFRLVPDDALDERGYEWRARAAMWHGDWEQAAEWLHTMPPELAADPRWAYFRGRALEKLGRTQQSNTIFRTLAQTNGTFGLYAAWRLGETYAPVSKVAPYDVELQQQLLARLALVRARELFHAGRTDWANAEWRIALADADAATRIQAARLASSWGWHVQAVQTLKQGGGIEDLELQYPDPHPGLLRAAAQWSGISADWIYGVMRQESLFLPTAVSSSQAYGLLQLLLPTARHVAQRWQKPLPVREDLFRPEINIPLGAAYLRDMSDRFGGQFPIAAAAYNAGPNAVARWLPDAPVDADIWIDNIPFSQTRGYVGKLLWHIAVHRWRKTGEPQDLSALLAPVQKPSS